MQGSRPREAFWFMVTADDNNCVCFMGTVVSNQ